MPKRLENMFTQGKITFDEYVESLDADSVMPKVKLESILQKRKEAQAQISQINEQAQLMQQQAMMNNANQQEINNIQAQGSALMNQFGNQAA